MKKNILLIPAIIAALLFALTGCQNPVVEPMHTFVHKTIGPYVKKKIAEDPDLTEVERSAMNAEVTAMERLTDEAMGYTEVTDE